MGKGRLNLIKLCTFALYAGDMQTFMLDGVIRSRPAGWTARTAAGMWSVVHRALGVKHGAWCMVRGACIGYDRFCLSTVYSCTGTPVLLQDYRHHTDPGTLTHTHAHTHTHTQHTHKRARVTRTPCRWLVQTATQPVSGGQKKASLIASRAAPVAEDS